MPGSLGFVAWAAGASERSRCPTPGAPTHGHQPPTEPGLGVGVRRGSSTLEYRGEPHTHYIGGNPPTEGRAMRVQGVCRTVGGATCAGRTGRT